MNHSSSIENKKKIELLRKELHQKQQRETQVLPLAVTYNRKLPNERQITQNHWSILKTNKTIEKTFSIN